MRPAQVTQAPTEAQAIMQEAMQLADNDDPELGPLHGDDPDISALPMMPRDIFIPGALLSCGTWAFIQVQTNQPSVPHFET